MRVLVTGGAGFIGARTVMDLLAQGHAATVVDNFDDYYPAAQKRINIEAFVEHSALRFLRADLLEIDVDGMLDACDAVLHLAGQPGVRKSWVSFDDYLRANVTTTHRLLDAASGQSAPPRIVLASSSSVYGASTSYPTSVDAPPSPTSPYGVTKLAAESLALVYAHSFGLPVVVLRYFTVYGPGQRPDMAFFRLLVAAMEGTEFELLGDGTQVRDFTFADDVAAANIAALTGPLEPGTVLNVGGGQPTSLAPSSTSSIPWYPASAWRASRPRRGTSSARVPT